MEIQFVATGYNGNKVTANLGSYRIKEDESNHYNNNIITKTANNGWLQVAVDNSR